MIKNLLIIVALIYSSLSWAAELQVPQNPCAAKIEDEYSKIIDAHKLSGTLSGQKLCRLVEARFNAMAYCQEEALDQQSRNKSLISFAHFLSATEAMSVGDGELEIRKLKAKWKSSSFLEQRKIQMRIQQIRTCFFPQRPSGEEDVLQNASR